MIEVIVDNVKIQYYKATCTKSIQAGSGQFMFVIGEVTQSFAENTQVQIRIDGTQVLNGKIEVVEAVTNKDEAYIVYQGRDNSSTAVDSTFNSVIEFNRFLNILDLLNFVLTPFEVNVTQENQVPPFTAFELPTAEVGENVFEFCDKLCRIRQSILTSNNDGGLLITTRGLTQTNDTLVFGQNGNITERNTHRNVANEFDRYTVYSQNNSTLDNLNNLVNVNASIGTGVRTKAIIENNALDVQECRDRANFEQQLDRRRAFRYKAVVPRHSQSNNTIWDKNLRVSLRDDSININETMLINTVEWRQSSNDISTCLLMERI